MIIRSWLQVCLLPQLQLSSCRSESFLTRMKIISEEELAQFDAFFRGRCHIASTDDVDGRPEGDNGPARISDEFMTMK